MLRKEGLSLKESNPSNRRRMAQFTLQALLQKKRKVENELQALGQDTDGGHQRASLHDNPALETRKNVLWGILLNIGNLDEVEVIQPRQDTNKIGLGNRVTIEFPDGEEETYIVLSTDDVKHGDRMDIISHESPIGSALLERRSGETVVCRLPDEKQIKLKIKEIKPGDF